jgi:hypothetical protein
MQRIEIGPTARPTKARYDVSKVVKRKEEVVKRTEAIQRALTAPLLQIEDEDAGPPEETGSRKASLMSELVAEGKRWKKEATRLGELLTTVEAERDVAIEEVRKLRLLTVTAADLEAQLKRDIGREATVPLVIRSDQGEEFKEVKRRLIELGKYGKDVEHLFGLHQWLHRDDHELQQEAPASTSSAPASSSSGPRRPGLPSTERWAAEERARETRSGCALTGYKLR